MTTKATQWHSKPAGVDCPTCGYPAKFGGSHRATGEKEGVAGRWIRRKKTPAGWEEYVVHQDDEKDPAAAHVQAAKTRLAKKAPKIIGAARRVALGQTTEDVARELGMTAPQLHDWKGRYRAIWERAVDEAAAEMDALVDEVRAAAGSDAVLADPTNHLAKCEAAEKWLARRGEKLFSGSGEMTLSKFFESYYLPNCLGPGHKGSEYLYRMVLRRWAYVTADPPLGLITSELLAKFRNVLSETVTERGDKLSPTTVSHMVRQMQTLLDKAGPPGPRNRDAAGLISQPPWVRRPAERARPVRVVTDTEIAALWEAAPKMDVPWGDSDPGTWWRTLLCLAWNTGLRAGTLFALRVEWIDWEAHRIIVPPGAMKSRREFTVFLNDTAYRMLKSFLDGRRGELVFPMAAHSRQFWIHFHKLQTIAGIPREKHFGLHAIRKTHGTRLWMESPEAARLGLDHSDASVTIRHYVEAQAIIIPALARLTQPACFQPQGDPRP